jgi:hypothetical protein
MIGLPSFDSDSRVFLQSLVMTRQDMEIPALSKGIFDTALV